MLDVPPAHATDVAVRTRPDTPPVVTLPVGKIVPGDMLVRRCPVAHLVPVVTGDCEEFIGKLVHVGLQVFVRLGNLAAPDLACEFRPILDDERVGRNMLGILRDRMLE